MSGLARRLAEVRGRIAEAAHAVGRDPAEITLIAVSKFHPYEAVLEAHAEGVVDFGENLVQELAAKAEAVAKAGANVRWHFVGRLQRNKVNLLLRQPIHRVHSLDREELIGALASRAPAAGLDVLLQVNVGREPQKGGVEPEQALALARRVAAAPGLRLRGLMTIPPVEGAPRRHFEALRALGAEVRAELPGAVELSMGMTSDFAEAIACGATHVRIGTAIFGERAPHAQGEAS